MKSLVCAIAVALSLVFSTPVLSQQNPTHPTDPYAQLIGTTTVTVVIPDNAGKVNDARVDISFFLTSGNKVDYVMDARSVTITGSGNGSGVDAMSTKDLFSLLSQAAVAQGVALGFTPCSSVCSSAPADLTRLYHSTCVMRTGMGLGTHFEPYGVTYGTRDFMVCCPSGPGSTVVNLITWTGGTCPGGSESTFQ